MSQAPTTRYAKTADGVHIAYQAFGEGPVDVVFVHAFASHVELFWELPSFERFMRALGSFARVITFDKRGVGLSDRLLQVATLEARMDDLRTVLDAVGSERAVIFGVADGGAIACMFAATYPERTRGLVLFDCGVRLAWAPDYPWGMRQEEFEERLARRTEIWGNEDFGVENTRMTFVVTGEALAKDPGFVGWLTKLQRYASAPGDVATFNRMFFETDARSALTAIQVPCAVLYRTGWSEEETEEARWTADQIPGAQLIALSGDDDDPYLGDVDEVARVVEGFVGTAREEERVFERVLATVLFTDIVGSTELLATMGDKAWKEVVEQHHSRIRALIARFRGVEMDTAGDGFFATFDGPERAIRCAGAIAESVKPLGIEVRAGLHTGEVEIVDGKAAGMAVVIGARIGGLAVASEVLVSQTVKDLTAGSGLAFDDAGDHELKGVPDRWRVYRASQAGAGGGDPTIDS
jgi:class 3 adenylate cyclase